MKRWTIFGIRLPFIYGPVQIWTCDLRSRHSLSTGGSPLACACGFFLNALFPAQFFNCQNWNFKRVSEFFNSEILLSTNCDMPIYWRISYLNKSG